MGNLAKVFYGTLGFYCLWMIVMIAVLWGEAPDNWVKASYGMSIILASWIFLYASVELLAETGVTQKASNWWKSWAFTGPKFERKSLNGGAYEDGGGEALRYGAYEDGGGEALRYGAYEDGGGEALRYGAYEDGGGEALRYGAEEGGGEALRYGAYEDGGGEALRYGAEEGGDDSLLY
jgi:hypothetical protein